jgi:hypothetical protein
MFLQVLPLGIVTLANMPAPADAKHSKTFYVQQLKTIVNKWVTCSTEGEYDTICKCATTFTNGSQTCL